MDKIEWARKILGIELNITDSELKSVYRKLCMQWHPDKNQDNAEYANKKMTEINAAYTIMVDYMQNKSAYSQTYNNQRHARKDTHTNQSEILKRAYSEYIQAIHEYQDKEKMSQKARDAAKEKAFIALQKYLNLLNNSGFGPYSFYGFGQRSH